MRLWHEDLVPYLPKRYIAAQWADIKLTVELMKEYQKIPAQHRTILIQRLNKVSVKSFAHYIMMVHDAMGRDIDEESSSLIQDVLHMDFWPGTASMDIWHNKDYLKQCFYNLQEKNQCGVINDGDYNKIVVGYLRAGGEL